MRRRKFFTVLGGAVAWPLIAHAQSAMPVVGFLHYGSANKLGDLAAAVRQGLKETGYIEGQNVTIVYRWAEGHYDRLPALAAELVHRQVNVIMAGGNKAAQVVKKATASIPIPNTGRLKRQAVPWGYKSPDFWPTAIAKSTRHSRPFTNRQ
jgi:putative ABC transport system substrate-binding protein